MALSNHLTESVDIYFNYSFPEERKIILREILLIMDSLVYIKLKDYDNLISIIMLLTLEKCIS